MSTSPQGFNNGTQSFINFDNHGGTVLTQVVDIQGGTITDGSIKVTEGTISAGTIRSQGVDSGGTFHTIATDTAGVTQVNLGNVAIGTYGGQDLVATNLTSGMFFTENFVYGTAWDRARGTSGTAFVALAAGTLTSLPNLPQGSINVTAGTINTGTINVGTFVMPSGTLSVLPNLPQGSINVTAGTIATLGTMGTLGLVNTVTTVSNITNGSIVMTLGTVAAHAVTAATVTAGTINAGTIATLGTMGTLGLVNTVTTVSNITNGSIVVTAGTVAAHAITAATVTAGTINTGTINTGTVTVSVGTINHGTIDGGTIQLNPFTATNTISHVGTSGTTAIGTLLAAPGASTAAYVTHYHMLAISGTLEMILAFGSQTNGPQVIAHGLFPAGAGMVTDISYPHGYGTTNSPLTYQILSGSGTASWDVNYFPHI